jgi:hypothetical protein
MEGNRTRRSLGRLRRRMRGPKSLDIAVAGILGLLALIAWQALAATAGAITLEPDDTPQGRAIERVPIGKDTDLKTYLRIDTPCPLRILGPGTLDFYVRAHIPPGGPEAVDATITMRGLTGFEEQRWVVALRLSRSSSYGDDRPGGLTGGQKLTIAIPPDLHEVTIKGTSSLGDPVYAIFYYSGPPAPPPGAPAEGASAAPAAGSAKKASPWDLSGDFSLGTIYDDNVCRYSDATLALFQSNTEPWRFAITNKEDVLLDTQLDAELSRKLLFGQATSLRLRHERWDYIENAIKTNTETQVRLRQRFRGSDYLDLSYTYAPDNYIKELGDREPYLARTTTPYLYYHFYVTRNAFDLDYFYRYRPWLRIIFSGGRVLRYYNRRFLENDLWEWNVGIEPEARYGRFYFRVRYAYYDVKARGYDSVGETLVNSDNDGDGSYEKDAYTFRLTYRPKSSPYRAGELGHGAAVIPGLFRQLGAWIDFGLIKLRTSSIYFQYDYARQFYTSQQPLRIDPLHVGRLDEQFQPRLVWTSKTLRFQTSLEAGIRYTRKTAKSPAGVIGENDPSEEKDYTGTRVWLQATWPLPL